MFGRLILAITMLALLTGRAFAAPDGEASVIRYEAGDFASQNPKTALDMIHWLPGFTFSSGDATVRGFTGSVGNVLIDGDRPADKQFRLDQILQRISPNQVDHIEVIRGGAPGIDMLGQAVVANLVRKKQAADSAALTLADTFSMNGHNLPGLTLEGTRHGNGGRTFTGAISVSRYLGLGTGTGPQTRRDISGNTVKSDVIDTASGGTTAFAYGVVESPLWSGQFRGNANIAWTDFYNRVLDRGATNSSLLREHLGGPLGAQLSGEAGASYKRGIASNLSSESLFLLRLRGQSFSSRQTAAGIDQVFNEHDHGGETILRSELKYQRGGITAETGLEGAYNWLGTTNSFTFNGFAIPLPNARATVNETRAEAFAKLSWTASAALQIEAGLRFEYSRIASQADVRQARDLTYPKPRLTLTFTPDKTDQLRLRMEREVGQLDFNNFVAASALDTASGVLAGNTNILPQESWVLEGAYEHRFWNSGIISLSLSHALLSNAIDRIPVRNPANLAASFDAPGNIGNGILDRVDAQLTLPLDHWGLAQAQIKASGVFQHSRVTDPTTGQKRIMSDMHANEYSIEFRKDMPEIKLTWGASITSSCWQVAANKDCSRWEYRFNEIDDYHIAPAANLFAEYQAAPAISLRFEADNILSGHYNRGIASYGGPRDVFPLSYREVRSLATSPFFKLSVRAAL